MKESRLFFDELSNYRLFEEYPALWKQLVMTYAHLHK